MRDFQDFVSRYDYDQVLRALRMLVRNGELVKIGHGIYAKARQYFNGMVLPSASIGELAEEALRRLGVKVGKPRAWIAYNNGDTTQFPNGRVIAVDRRVRRRIGYNGNYVTFERIRRKK